MTYTTDMDVTKSATAAAAAAAAASPYPMIYNQDNTVFVSPHAEYNIPVVALHSCKYYRSPPIEVAMSNGVVDEANPDDPNELSFTKGEVLHVHERKGNWWQARQADGTVGMIPSNYVSCLATAHPTVQTTDPRCDDRWHPPTPPPNQFKHIQHNPHAQRKSGCNNNMH